MAAEEGADAEEGTLMMAFIGYRSVAFAKCRVFLDAKLLGRK